MVHKRHQLTRRQFVKTTSAGIIAASQIVPAYAFNIHGSKQSGKLAALGGKPVRSNKSWPEWPFHDQNVIDSVVKQPKAVYGAGSNQKTALFPLLRKNLLNWPE